MTKASKKSLPFKNILMIGLILLIGFFLGAQYSLTSTLTHQKVQEDIQPNLNEWEKYENKKYGYTIKYPKEAEIHLAQSNDFSYESDENGNPKDPELEKIGQDKRFEYLHDKYGGELCVTLDYKEAYIQISASENENNRHTICSPTGVGTDDIAISEQVTINGKEYLASGFRNNTSNNEWLVVDLDHGTRITYGNSINNESYVDYEKIKPEVKKIVSTFEFIK